MSQALAIEIWIHGACAAGGYGGWSYVIRADNQWRGVAGGATRTDAETMALTGLAAALDAVKGEPRGAALRLHLSDPSLLEPADTNAALRAGVTKALAGWAAPPAILDSRRAANARAWSDFLSSWADFARDKAKARGAFSAPIPKLNIAKFAHDAI